MGEHLGFSKTNGEVEKRLVKVLSGEEELANLKTPKVCGPSFSFRLSSLLMMVANISKGYPPHWAARVREVFAPVPFLSTAAYLKKTYPLSRLYPSPVQGSLFRDESS